MNKPQFPPLEDVPMVLNVLVGRKEPALAPRCTTAKLSLMEARDSYRAKHGATLAADVLDAIVIHRTTMDNITSSNGFTFKIESNIQDAKLHFKFPLTMVKWRSEVNKKSAAIFDDFKQLSILVKNHEAVLARRWQSKSSKKRRALLNEAWLGDVLPEQRPDWAVLNHQHGLGVQALKGSPAAASKQDVPRLTDINNFLHPMINMAELNDRTSLLRFITARAKHHPIDFVHADYHAMAVGRAIGPLMVEFPELARFSTQFRDTSKSQEYVEHASSDIELQRQGSEMLHFPTQTLFVLVAQARIMAFLRNCVTLMLHDLVPSLSALSPPLVSQRSSTSQPEDKSMPVATAMSAWNSPFTWHDTFGSELIGDTISARRDFYLDHLINLRENPGYYFHCVSFVYEGVDLSIMSTRDQETSIMRLLSMATNMYEFWSRLWERYVDRYEAILNQAQCRADFCSLAEDQVTTLKHLWLDFHDLALNMWHSVERTIAHTGTLSEFWQRYARSSSLTTQQIDRAQAAEAELIQLVSSLRGSIILSPHAHVNAADELQKFLQSENAAFVHSKAGLVALAVDMSQISACMRQLDFGFLCSGFSLITKEIVDARDKWGPTFDPGERTVMATNVRRAIAEHGCIGDKLLYYPVHKRKSEAVVRTLQHAERKLDVFWTHYIRALRYYPGKFSKAITVLADTSGLLRTPDFTKPPQPSRKDENAPIDPGVSLMNLHLDLQHRTEQTLTEATSNTGTQRRQPRIARHSNVHPNHENAQIGRESSQSQNKPAAGIDSSLRIPVDDGALSLFRIILPGHYDESKPGEVQWGRFLHAMRAAGFTAENLQGSAWRFAPKGQRGIHFHEPHPESKIHLHRAMSMGRRLNRAYGWTTETFYTAANGALNAQAEE